LIATPPNLGRNNPKAKLIVIMACRLNCLRAGCASGLGSLDSPPAPMSGATLHRFWERKEKRYVNVYHWQRSAQATSQE